MDDSTQLAAGLAIQADTGGCTPLDTAAGSPAALVPRKTHGTMQALFPGHVTFFKCGKKFVQTAGMKGETWQQGDHPPQKKIFPAFEFAKICVVLGVGRRFQDFQRLQWPPPIRIDLGGWMLPSLRFCQKSDKQEIGIDLSEI